MHTGPDADVLIGPRLQAVLRQRQGQGPGRQILAAGRVEDGRRHDVGMDLVRPRAEPDLSRHGEPGPVESRAAARATTSGPPAFSRATPTPAQARWFYQFTPHDLHDWDGDQRESSCSTCSGRAQPRKVLVRPERNGYHLRDRSHERRGAVGRALCVHQLVQRRRSEDRASCTSIRRRSRKLGQRRARHLSDRARREGLEPSAYSPRLGCSTFRTRICAWTGRGLEANYIAGTPYVGAEGEDDAGPGGNRGEFSAWDVQNARKRVVDQGELPVWSGAVATAGDVVFYGTMEGWFKAVDATTGELLWQFKTGSGIIGQPVTYRGPDGQQYVAVLSGVGGWSGAIVSGDLDPRDGTAALGFVNAMAGSKAATTKGGSLYVFRLP